MDWVIEILIGTGILYALILLVLFVANCKKSVGLGQFSRTPKQVEDAVSKQIAPAPFYYKQRTFRLCYGTFQALDKLLLVTSIFYSALTAYLILDPDIPAGTTIVCLVISTVASTLKSSLNLDKIAKPYIEAVRILEAAILRYEYSAIDAHTGNFTPDSTPPSGEPSNPYDVLLKANDDAERLISHGNE